MIPILIAGLELVVIFVFIALWRRRRGSKLGFWIAIVLGGITAAACIPLIIIIIALLTGPPIGF